MTDKKSVFVFLGPPGSGKGTLASKCVQNDGWVELSTGNLCRKHIAEQTEVGKKIDFAIKSGKLISDELITQMVVDWFENEASDAQAVILDGYPRTIAQAHALEDLLNKPDLPLRLQVVRFSISDNMVIDRLSSRYVCGNKSCQTVYSLAQGSSLAPKNGTSCDVCDSALLRRSDDTKDTIKKRLEVYYQHEKELLGFYDNVGRAVREINVEKPLENVFDEFNKLIN